MAAGSGLGSLAPIVFAACIAFALGGCSGGGGVVRADLGEFPAGDVEGFDTLADAETAAEFHEVTVADIARLMDAGQSFVLFCAFDDCPWCKATIGPVSEVAAARGWQLAFLDTRKDPSWESNLDIDDYDLFVERFGDWLEPDADGVPHLYVPSLFFVRNGQVVAVRQGVLEGYDDPDVALNDEQRGQLDSELNALFDLME